jgi:ubiquinone/menaquinone biosynthesis C-methylase UbiE
MHNLPYGDEEFDWTFSSTAIEHCYDAKKAASELFRVSKFGVYVITDLETEESFKRNISHFTHHDDPCEWVNLMRAPGWQLMKLFVPQSGRIDMLWLRKKYVAQFLNEPEA